MKISSNDCKVFIAEWVKNNPDSIPLDPYSVSCRSAGSHWVSDGTKTADWTRLTKKTIDGVVYRLFESGCTILDSDICVLLEEKDGQLTMSTHHIRSDFLKTHPAVGKWVREYTGVDQKVY